MSASLYVDCVAGVAGDMLLAALIDAGADHAAVAESLSNLAVPRFDIRRSRTRRHGISATRVHVTTPGDGAHRTWREVRELIDAAAFPERARVRAQRAFRGLALAEAEVHGTDPEELRFHEVGSLDSIVDTCGVALALEQLDIGQVSSSELPAPRGFIESAHGRLPLPAPASLELLKGAPMYGVEIQHELVTPTGAALVSTMAEKFGPLPPMRVESVGYGAGARDLEEIPNLCRVVVGTQPGPPERPGGAGQVSLIETNLDDLSPEMVPDAIHGCFAAGALDVWTTPVQMKKGRPGLVLSALCHPDEERHVADAMLRETSTLGVRFRRMERWELERTNRRVQVAGHDVNVKIGILDGEVVNVSPEHDDCLAVAEYTGRTVKSVWAAALASAMKDAPDAV